MVYATLMCAGKLITGIPVLVWSIYSARKARRGGSDPTPVGVHVGQTVIPNARTTATAAPFSTQVAAQGWRTHLAPALFVGIAMVARGEIGLLIAQVAHGDASTPALLGDDAFLVCIWATLLCTLVAPIGVGLLLRIWKRPPELRV